MRDTEDDVLSFYKICLYSVSIYFLNITSLPVLPSKAIINAAIWWESNKIISLHFHNQMQYMLLQKTFFIADFILLINLVDDTHIRTMLIDDILHQAGEFGRYQIIFYCLVGLVGIPSGKENSGGCGIFLRGANSQSGCTNLLFCNFVLPKTAWKWKNLDPKGASLAFIDKVCLVYDTANASLPP